jgi:uncharacterized repeat protein (TIGR02543 family)
MPSENITLYAKWTVNQYEIIYGIIAEDYDSNLDIPLHVGETVKQVCLGSWHSAAVTSEGRLFTWGDNWGGELGDGTHTARSLPTDITGNFRLHSGEAIVQVALGCFFSVAMTSEGRLFTWGVNDHGQLGYGTKVFQSLPVEITGNIGLNAGETIVQISSGLWHLLALTSEGRLLTWGRNYEGQLGDGTKVDKWLPTDITDKIPLHDEETIIQIALGGYHSSALTSEGRLFIWGSNEYGQLGDGLTIDKTLPADITGRFDLNAGEKITQMSLGKSHSSALTSGGRLFTWGYNYNGQLGDGTTANKSLPTEITSNFDLITGDTLMEVCLSYAYSLAKTSEGRIFTWGHNLFGQLGDGTTVSKVFPTDITGNFSLNADETIIQISLGSQHASVLSSDGHLFMWGRNQFGELGEGTISTKLIPVKTRFCYSEITFIEIYDFNNDILPYVLTRDGYTFSGWYRDVYLENLFDLTTMPAQNIVLFGKFIPNE